MKTIARSAPTRTRRASSSRLNRSPIVLETLEGRALMASDLFGASVVFMADNVAGSDELARSFRGSEIFHLDSRTNVFDQISSALKGRSGLSSIQFVTHGSAGRVDLGGGQEINARTLEQNAGSVRAWGQALADDGDILLWGCSIGQGTAGKALVSRLASITGADVAASSNLTGTGRLGGDWNLEVKIGRVESVASFITPFKYNYTLAAPTIAGAEAGQTVDENNTIRPFDGVVIASDVPSTSLTVTVSLDTAAKGVFTSASLTASGFANSGGGVYTFNGTAAQATQAIGQLVFDPSDNRVNTGSTETTTFTISANNHVNAATTDNTTTVVTTAINDAPTIAGTVAAQAVNDTSTVSPFTGVTLGDADAPTQTLSVTVSLDNAAKGSFTSASLTASGFTAAGNGVYTFSGTAAASTTAIQALVFQPTANRVAVGLTESTVLEIHVNDGVAAETCDATTSVVSTSVNTAPIISGASAGQAVNDTSTVTPFSGLSITDPDPTQRVTVSVTLDAAAKGVFTAASLAATGFTDAGSGVYTFTGTGAQATTAIRALVFNPTDNRVASGATETTTFALSASDTVAAPATNSTTTVVSTNVNDAPTITGAVAAQAVNDNATIQPFSAVTIGDADPSTTLDVSVTLDTASKGVFTSASLTASGFVSAGGGVYTFTGSAAAATTAIRALVFDPTNNRVAVASTETTTFDISADDGVAAPTVDSTTTAVSTSVNDAPSITGASAAQAVNDNSTVSPFAGVTLADVDPSTTLTVSVTLDTAAKGVFTGASLTASGFNDDGGGVYSFTGSPSAATTAIQALVYDPTNNRVNPTLTETTTFTISVNDGVASAVTNNTTTVVSTSVNDAPTIGGTVASQAVNDNATLSPFSAVTISDADGSQSLNISISLDAAAKGVFTSASLTSSGFSDEGGGVYSFTGTASAATTAIRALVFNPTDNRVAVSSTETTTFFVSVDDGIAAPATDNATSVDSTSVNDAPTITGATAGQTVNDTSTVSPFSGVTIGDVDPSTTLSVTVSLDTAAKGVFTSASLTASGFNDDGGGVYSFTGTPSAATTAIRSLVFDPTNNRVAVGSTETTTFTVSADDSVAAATTNSTSTVVSTSVNDAPSITGASAGQAVNDNATVSPFSGVTIADVDPSTSLTVSVTLDTAAKGVFTNASLTSSGFSSSGGGVYTFTGSPSAATTAIRALVFDPTNDRVNPTLTETTTFTISVSDGVASAVTNNTTTVVSTSVNDAPSITGASAGQTVNDTSTVSPFSGLTIGDADAAQSLSVSVTLDSSAKGVFTAGSLTTSGFVSAGGGVYTFTGTATQATTAIRALVFNPTDNRVAVNTTETTTFTVDVDDSIAAATTNSTTTVLSNSVNDAPIITGTVGGQTVNDNSTVSPFVAVSFSDADPSNSLTVSVTLDSAAKGVFTSASLTASGFVDAGSGVYTFTGTPSAATTAIQDLVFDPANNRAAVGSTETTTFTISANDGFAAAVTDSAATVVSTSVNDTPTIGGVSAGQTVNDNATINPFSAVTLGDVDPSTTLSVSVAIDTAAKGVFTSASLLSSGFSAGGGGTYTFTGSPSAATTAIRALVFDPTNDRVSVGTTETSTFTISVSDGVAATQTDSATTVVSTSVNDAPTITGASAGQTVNDTSTVAPFSALTIGNADPGQNVDVTVSLDTAAKGIFTSASLTSTGFVDAGGGSYTFSGSASAATTAIRGLVFDPANNRVASGATETTTFTVSVDDGIASAVADSATTVVSTNVNDAPSITGASAGQSVNDNAFVNPFSAVSVADVDPSTTLTVSVTIDTAAKGVFTPASLTTSGFASAGGGVYTFTGSPSAVTTALQALIFNPTDNRVNPTLTETSTFTISVNDGVASAVTDNATTVVSTSVNDAPSITGAVAGQAVNDTAFVSPFSGLTIADADAAQTVSVSVTVDTAAKGVFTSASLTASGFADAGGGVYTFTGTGAQATTAIRQLSFDPANNRVSVGSTETATFTVSVDDAIAAATTDNATTVVSTSINDTPTFSGASAGQAVNDVSTVSPFSAFTISDVDSPAQSLTIQVTLDTAAKGSFTSASLTASGFSDDGGGVYSFTGTASAATTAIRQLSFQPTNNRVNPGSTETTTFTVSANDSFATATNATTTVVSTPVNDAPTVTGTTGGQAVNDTAFVSPFSGVTVGDADTNQSLTVTVTLDTAAKGIFTSASLTASGFVSSGSGVYTFTGTGAQATTAIRQLSFDPANNRVAPASTETTTFTISANDHVASAVTDTASTVVSTSVNDAPSLTGAVAGQTVNDSAFVSPFSAVTIADVDVGQSVTVTVSLDTAAKGTFTSASLTSSGFVNNNDGTYTFVGTASAATTAIRALSFDPTDNRVSVGSTETTTLSISVNDGVAAPASSSATTVVATSVNDVPTYAGAVAAQAVNDNATLSPFTSFTITDVDSPAQTLTVQVVLNVAAKGSFTANSLTASGFSGLGAGVYSFTGTASAATTAIRQLVFQPTNNYVNPGSTDTTNLIVLVNDGVGSSLNNTTTVVSTSVNDAPTITGAVANQSISDSTTLSQPSAVTTVRPFQALSIADADTAQSLTVSVTLDDSAKGVFTSASLTASGFAASGGGVYTFTGTAAAATTAIRQLNFDAANNRVAVGTSETTTFTVAVNDQVAAVVSNNTTTVDSLSLNDAPLISGALSGQIINETATVNPFSGIVLFDVDAGQQVDVSVTLDNAAKGVFTSTSLTASGFTDAGGGVYTMSGSAAEATDALRALVFNPANNRVAIGSRETTTFTISISDSVASPVTNSATTVLSTSVNEAPSVGAFTASPGTVIRLNTITLAATGLTDPDNAVRSVQFYRDTNSNGTLDPSTDALLGTVLVAAGNASLTVATTGFTAGSATFFARGVDVLNLPGSALNTSATITNRAPTITSVTRSIDPVVNLGDNITLTAVGAADADGTISRVEFYRDADNDGVLDTNVDTLLGQDTSAVGGYTLTTSTSSFSVGTNRYFARVIDNDASASTAVAVTGRINAAPTFTTFGPSAGSVARRSSFTLSASGAADGDGTIAAVDFYRDSNNNGTYEAGTDVLLGTDLAATSGAYTLLVSTVGYVAGTNTFFAKVRDNNGGASSIRTTTINVTDLAPTVASITTTTPRVTLLGNNITFTVNGALDADGTIASAQIYRDADASGTLDINVDTLLGTDSSATGGFTLTTNTNAFSVGSNLIFARILDNDGMASSTVSTTVVVNAVPTLTSLAGPGGTVARRSLFTLTASGVADSDGTVNRVEFYRDVNANGTYEAGTDLLLGSDTLATGGYTFQVNSTGYATGTARFLARVFDNNLAPSSVQAANVTITNLSPTITSIAATPAVVTVLGNSVTIAATGPADLDGTIASVQFYRDADGNSIFDANVDTLLGSDTSATGGYALVASTAGFAVGSNRIFARSVDNEGATSSVVTTTFNINAAPTVGSVTANPDPILRSTTYTLSANSVADSDGSVTRVDFYRDRGVLGTFESSADLFLGSGTLSGGVWRITLAGSALTAGTTNFFARALDNNGVFSTAVMLTVTVV